MKKIISLVLALFLVPTLAFASVGINLNGGDMRVTQGSTFQEPGYSAFSSFDGDITSSVAVSNPGTGQAGVFTITYSVTDSNLDSASASRTLTVMGAGGQTYCFGPTAPGWDTNLPDGGCGKKVFSGETMFGSVKYDCPFFIAQCVIK